MPASTATKEINILIPKNITITFTAILLPRSLDLKKGFHSSEVNVLNKTLVFVLDIGNWKNGFVTKTRRFYSLIQITISPF